MTNILVWAKASLERGDKVIATARNATTLYLLVAAYGMAVLPLACDGVRNVHLTQASREITKELNVQQLVAMKLGNDTGASAILVFGRDASQVL